MIRTAGADDTAWILAQLRAFAAAYGTQRSLVPSDPVVAEAVVAGLIAQHVFFVGLRMGERAGLIAGALVVHPYNPELRVLQELFWWVDPADRGTSLGARLLEAFVAYGRLHADWITMTLEAHSPIGDRVLVKRGFRPHEQSFLLEV